MGSTSAPDLLRTSSGKIPSKRWSTGSTPACTNGGPADAFDFDVRFRISEPYHTVGGEADFDTFVGIKHIDILTAGAASNVFVEWTPESADQPHACVKVDLINLVGTDTNEFDNWAQENLHIVASVTSSPYHPVTSATT
jgi:hypothetical protein